MNEATGTPKPWYRHRLAWVLVCFVVTYALIPLTRATYPVITTVTLVAGIWLAVDALHHIEGPRAPVRIARWTKGICLLLVAAAVFRAFVVDASDVLHGPAGMAGLLLYGVGSTLAMGALLRHVMTAKRVGLDELAGAICVYYLMAVVWACLYVVCLVFDPAAFTGLTPDIADAGLEPLTMQYFSLVTLTTLGYGDISPANEWAGTLATMEAFIGQVYMTVLIARLVSMYSTQGRSEQPDD